MPKRTPTNQMRTQKQQAVRDAEMDLAHWTRVRDDDVRKLNDAKSRRDLAQARRLEKGIDVHNRSIRRAQKRLDAARRDLDHFNRQYPR